MEMPITDPAAVLFGLGALCGLVAAWFWAKVAASIDETGERVKGQNTRFLGYAAVMTAGALGLASFGYLLARFT